MAANWRGTLLTFVVGGIAGVFLAPVVAPALARWSRPGMKAAIKAGLAIYERGRLTAAELRETVEDVTAELAAERAAPAGDTAVEPPHAVH
jgi:hypothetical protein